MGSGNWDSRQGGAQNAGSRGGFGAEAAHRLELGDPHSHRLDDAPAARQCAQAYGGMRHQDHPEWNIESLQDSRRKQGTGHDSHRLLGIIAAVSEAVGGRGEEL